MTTSLVSSGRRLWVYVIDLVRRPNGVTAGEAVVGNNTALRLVVFMCLSN